MTAYDKQVDAGLDFLRRLFVPDDWIELRLLPRPESRWFRLADDDGARAVLEWAAAANSGGRNVYFGANPRTKDGGRRAEDVALARCLFADFDDGMTAAGAQAAISAAGLPAPSIVVETGGGVHTYWPLVEPVRDMPAWTAGMKVIIRAVGSDKAVHDGPRIMRLPGSRNCKPDRGGAWCRVVHATDDRHDIAAFHRQPVTPIPAARLAVLADLTRDYMRTGQVGDGGRREALFTIACDLNAAGWTERDGREAIMSRVHLLEKPLDPEQVADLPRQIHSAFSKAREPGYRSSGNLPQKSAEPVETLEGAATADRPRCRLVLARASDIEVSEVQWLWPQRIVGDGLTIITGPVGVSKSLISVDVAARVTTGGKWPDNTGHAPAGSVILFGNEDDAGKVVVPRLMAAGADLARVYVCQGTTVEATDEHDGRDSETVLLEHHIEQLRAALEERDDCRLIVFDPLPDFIRGDENKSAEVRAALVPLARLAQERNVAVLAVLHQNKKSDLTTAQRIAGSGAFAQIARVVLAIGTHPEDAGKETDKRRVCMVAKNNYGPRDVGQAYAIETRSNGQPGLVWHAGQLTMDADDIARRPTGGGEHEARRSEAVDLLRELLAAGEHSAADAQARLQDAGMGRRQVEHAAQTLNVIRTKRRDGWYWRLPARTVDDATPLPDPAFAAYDLDHLAQR